MFTELKRVPFRTLRKCSEAREEEQRSEIFENGSGQSAEELIICYYTGKRCGAWSGVKLMNCRQCPSAPSGAISLSLCN